jgi:hypothetical protein
VRFKVGAATVEDVAPLDFATPFDELTELRALLTTQEIAEFTGLRRETISRARPDSRFQRRTENALRDLYLVVTKMRSVAGGDLVQLAAVLRRSQTQLGGRSIAELLREGEVDVVLESLSEVASTEARKAVSARERQLEEQVAKLLAAHPELRSRLPAIEAAVVRHFGPGARVERQIIIDYEGTEEDDELLLHVRTDLSLEERIERLSEVLQHEEELLAPVRRHLVIGIIQ